MLVAGMHMFHSCVPSFRRNFVMASMNATCASANLSTFFWRVSVASVESATRTTNIVWETQHTNVTNPPQPPKTQKSMSSSWEKTSRRNSRLEVVTRGFDVLTENLPPIYQAADHTLQLAAAKTQQTPATPATDTPSSTQTRTGRATDNYDKLQSAPAPNLGFPVGYMTVAEMAAFHPNALKSWDMIDRFCGNGGSQATFAAMINHFREMERGRILPNSVYRMMKGSMNKRAKVQPEYITWTTGTHHNFPKPRSFDPASVSVTGFRTPADGKIKATAPPIPIKNMAIGVKNFPTGYDALDLTRAVRYCQAHPDENWLYPDDYERLVNQLPQDPHLAGYPVGPAPVQVGHQDRATIGRYTTVQMAAGVRNAFGRKRDRHGRLLKVQFKSDEECLDSVNADSDADSERDVDFESLDQKEDWHKHFTDDTDDDEFSMPSYKPTNKRKKFNSNPRASRNCSGGKFAQSSRLPNLFSVNDVDSASDNGAYEGPKKMKVKEVRRSMRETKVIKTYNVDQVAAIDNEDEAPKYSQPTQSSI
jgi:hypothetical protein